MKNYLWFCCLTCDKFQIWVFYRKLAEKLNLMLVVHSKSKRKKFVHFMKGFTFFIMILHLVRFYYRYLYYRFISGRKREVENISNSYSITKFYFDNNLSPSSRLKFWYFMGTCIFFMMNKEWDILRFMTQTLHKYNILVSILSTVILNASKQ